jgi:hypothetical protein
MQGLWVVIIALVCPEKGIIMIPAIWRSFRALPLWVQFWVAVILMPVNMIAAIFYTAPNGLLIAVMAIGAMALNGIVMLIERGFSKSMALPHVLIWTPMVVLIGWMLQSGAVDGIYAQFLWILLVVDLISLAFDYKDTRDWFRGDRAVAGS